MSEPFLGQISVVGFNFAPRGWAFCDGQLLPINQNQSLYSLLGTTYGGDGRTTFALPDLRGRIPLHEDPNHALGQRAGAEHVTLTLAGMPAHSHGVTARMRAQTGTATGTAPGGATLAAGTAIYRANAAAEDVNLDPAMIALGQQTVGGGQSFGTMGPYLALNFIIALQGLFPSRN